MTGPVKRGRGNPKGRPRGVKRAPDGFARVFVGVKIARTALAQVRALAEKETGGNLSEMIRRLLGEALVARSQRGAARRAA